jgi:hypothetical protein
MQVLDGDSSGSLNSSEFCDAIKKLVMFFLLLRQGQDCVYGLLQVGPFLKLELNDTFIR